MLKTSKIIGWSHGPHATENNNRGIVNSSTVKDNAMSTSLDSGVAGLRDTPVHIINNNNNNNMVMPATKATGASPTSTERDEFDVPKFIVDQATRTTYMKGRFLGKGGFARVHELTDLTTSVTFAGKIIPKSRITKPHHKEKIAREIEVHRHLRHRNVVRFHKYFEDDANVYIILENCSMRSLVHVLKCRTVLTEPEVRYYIKQLTEGVAYVHREGIIHRDLKLGNMFLSQEMDVKIGDFGLATRAADNRQVTICGTPNYIAPEVLSKLGHHYQADIWAIGCIMFALLIGQPPFETETLRETYSRITNNQYTIPPLLSTAARDLIKHLLHPDPKSRPTIPQILKHDFFTKSYVPETLSPSACTSVPTFSSSPEHQQNNNVLSADIKKVTTSVSTLKLPNWKTNTDKISILSDNLSNPTTTTPNNEVKHNNQVNSDGSPNQQKQSSIFINQQSPTTNSNQQQYKTKDRSKIIDKLASVIFTSPASKSNQTKRKSVTSGNLYNTLGCALDHMPSLAGTDNPVPLSISPLFISKWIDYSNKYGFGYQLSDGSVGVFFNDLTRINISADKSRVEFHDSSGRLSIVSPSSLPVWLEERYQLLRYFACYMDENLTEAGDNRPSSATSAGPSTRNSNNSSTSSTGSSSSPSIGSRFSSNSSQPVIPHIKRWDRTEKSIIMQLSSGTFQINFFSDHTKIVVIGEASSYDIQVLYINSERVSCTYRLSDLVTSGCDSAIRERLVYALSCLRQYAELDGEEV